MMQKYGFLIKKRSNGNVVISTPKVVWTIDFLPRSSFEERVEAVKWSLLTAGFAWSERVEKKVKEKLL